MLQLEMSAELVALKAPIGLCKAGFLILDNVFSYICFLSSLLF